MAVGNTFVNFGGTRDVALPFQRGTNSLIDAIQGTQDNARDRTLDAQDAANALEDTRQKNLNRAERERVRAAAASAAKRERMAIKDALTSFNKPGGIDTGLEVKNAINSTYEGITKDYNQLSGILSAEEENSKVLVDAANRKGDSITYDFQGRPVESKELLDAKNTEKHMQTLQNEAKSKYDFEVQTLDSIVNRAAPSQASDVYFDDKVDLPGVLTAKDLNVPLVEEQAADIQGQRQRLDTTFDTKVGGLNTALEQGYNANPQLLDTVTNPERVANEMYVKMIEDDVDPNTAQKTAAAWLKANQGPEVNKARVDIIKDEIKGLKDLFPENKVKKEEGGTTGTSGKGGSKKYNPNVAVEDLIYTNSGIEKIRDAKGFGEVFDKTFTDTPGSIRTKLDTLAKNNPTLKLTNADLYAVAMNSMSGTGDKAGNKEINMAEAQKRIEAGERANSYKGTSGTKTTTTQTTKGPTEAQARKLNALQTALEQELNPGATVAGTLGQDFITAAKRDGTLQGALKIPKKAPKITPKVKAKVQPKAETKKQPEVKKAKETPKTVTTDTVKNALTDTPKIKKILKPTKAEMDKLENFFKEEGLGVSPLATLIPLAKGGLAVKEAYNTIRQVLGIKKAKQVKDAMAVARKAKAEKGPTKINALRETLKGRKGVGSQTKLKKQLADLTKKLQKENLSDTAVTILRRQINKVRAQIKK